MKKKQAESLGLTDSEGPRDLGVRLYKLDASTCRPWEPPAEGLGITAPEYSARMGLFRDPLVPGWRAEDVVWEVALKEGYSLSSRVELARRGRGPRVYRVSDGEKGQSFRMCLDDRLTLEAVKGLDLAKDELFVCRDVALDDETAANLALQCRLKTI